MKIKFSFIFLCISILFLVNLKTAEASTSKAYKKPIIQVQNKIEEADAYPVVSEIESRVLGNSYPKEDIYNRLNRLEIKVFGSVSQKSLSDRVDNLNNKVLGENSNSEEDDNYSPNVFSSDSDNYSESYSGPSDNESLNNLLNKLEKQLLNQVYPNDTSETRVARLEKFIFNGSSSDYPMNERIERLATVIKAQPSNEIYQDLSQLGNSQMLNQGLSLGALILMIVAGLLL